jgi:hypothetical protein
MPIPKPADNETEEDFVTRCIRDENMIAEFGIQQRLAVCYTIYETEGIKLLKQVKEIIHEQKRTDFPSGGEDETVSLRNSKYPLINLTFAERIRNNHPNVWGLGGNILGNRQYTILKTIRDEKIASEDLTARQEQAIRLREAWIARHRGNFRIAGVIAQIKWHAIGEKGFDYMRNLVNDEIEKRS